MEITKNKNPKARVQIDVLQIFQFIPQSMVFFLEITNIRQKSQDFWFADLFLEIFTIHRLVWISQWVCGCFECVSYLFFITGLKFYKCCFIKDDLQRSLCIIGYDGVLCDKETHSRPYGFKNLQPRKKPTTVTRQLTKSRDLRQNYLCDFHLWALMKRH